MIEPMERFEPDGRHVVSLPPTDVLAWRMAAGLRFTPSTFRALDRDQLARTVSDAFGEVFGFGPSLLLCGELVGAIIEDGPSVAVCRPFAARIRGEAAAVKFPIEDERTGL